MPAQRRRTSSGDNLSPANAAALEAMCREAAMLYASLPDTRIIVPKLGLG